jgi:hypothetical protein
MWIVAQYLPVSFFSLKPAVATSSGGKTLLVPTPYALKMALLDAAIRSLGLAEGERLFPLLRDLSLHLEPPEGMIVMKSFSKIRRELKDKNDPEKAQRARARKEYPMQPTIAYREYVNYQGTFRLACQLADDHALAELLPTLLMRVNYLGKRGGFVQLLEPPQTTQELPAGQFVHLTAHEPQPFAASGTLQMLDDCGPGLTFAKVSVYSEARIILNKDRLLRHIVLPYRLQRSSRSYSQYQRIEIEEEG